MLKKTVFFAALALSGVVYAADADFTLVNRTGYAINEVFISPTQKDNWGRSQI